MNDDDLRARLRHADPAASLTPLAPDRASHLLEQTMSDTTGTIDTATRRRMPVLAAAAMAFGSRPASGVRIKLTKTIETGRINVDSCQSIQRSACPRASGLSG